MTYLGVISFVPLYHHSGHSVQNGFEAGKRENSKTRSEAAASGHLRDGTFCGWRAAVGMERKEGFERRAGGRNNTLWNMHCWAMLK